MDRTFRRALPVVGVLAIGLLSGCGDPDSRAAKYVKHGEELVASGQPDKARLEFRNAIKIKPTLAEPYYQLGLLDEAGGNLQNALTIIRRPSCRIRTMPAHSSSWPASISGPSVLTTPKSAWIRCCRTIPRMPARWR